MVGSLIDGGLDIIVDGGGGISNGRHLIVKLIYAEIPGRRRSQNCT